MYAEYTRPQLTFLALVPWVNVEVHITIIFNFFSYALDLLRLILTEWTVFIQCPHKKVSNDIASLQPKRVIFVFLSKKILNGIMKSEWLKEFCSNLQTIDFPLYWFIIKVLYYPIYTAFSSYLEKKRSLIQF